MSNEVFLYHYSSVNNVHNILSSGSLWATDYRYLNDTHELSAAMDMFIKEADEKFQHILASALHLGNSGSE
jgi:hypothetical protein